MRTGVPVGAMEIMDEVQMKVINKAGATGKVWKEMPTLFFKFSGTKAGVRDNIKVVEAIAKKHEGGGFEFAKDAQEAKTLWSARKEARELFILCVYYSLCSHFKSFAACLGSIWLGNIPPT